jgi:hypothetical protein
MRIAAVVGAALTCAVAAPVALGAPTFTSAGVPFPEERITLKGAAWGTAATCGRVRISRGRTVVVRATPGADGFFSVRWRLPASAEGRITLTARQTCGRRTTARTTTLLVSGN